MADDEIHVGDKGLELRATIKNSGTAVDISAATVKLFLFRKPDATVATNTASFLTAGTDGVLYFTTPTTTTLDQAGKWQLQSRVEFSGNVFHSDWYEFKVHKNLE